MTIGVFLTGILLFILQIGLLPGLVYEWFAPEFAIPMIVGLALIRGRREAVVYAVVFGVMTDAFSPGLFGIRTLLFVLLAYGLGSYRDTFAGKSAFAVTVVTFFAAVGYQLLSALLFKFLGLPITGRAFLRTIFSHETPLLVLLAYPISLVLMRASRRRRKVGWS